MQLKNSVVVLALLILSVSVNLEAGEDILDRAPTAREMYVSCLLTTELMWGVVTSETADWVVEFLNGPMSPIRCHFAMIGLIVNREGKNNRNIGQDDARWNFCLPETTNPNALMKDAYILKYESAAGGSKSFKPGSAPGKAFFIIALNERYPCN